MDKAVNHIVVLFIAASILSCNNQIDGKWLPKNIRETVIELQPLSTVPPQLISMLKDSIPNYYPVLVKIALPVELPLFAYYKPRDRYKADSIHTFLQSTRSDNVRIVAGITEKDISTKKGVVDDYGIMGYGYSPGYVCVVSTLRLKKDNPSDKLFEQRLLKTVIHELGHNFGLPHCSTPYCIMADAKGKLSQDSETVLCADCKNKLHLK